MPQTYIKCTVIKNTRCTTKSLYLFIGSWKYELGSLACIMDLLSPLCRNMDSQQCTPPKSGIDVDCTIEHRNAGLDIS